jgi:hypothetical protein
VVYNDFRFREQFLRFIYKVDLDYIWLFALLHVHILRNVAVQDKAKCWLFFDFEASEHKRRV